MGDRTIREVCMEALYILEGDEWKPVTRGDIIGYLNEILAIEEEREDDLR